MQTLLLYTCMHVCNFHTWSPALTEFLSPIMHTCNGVSPSLSVTVTEAAEMGWFFQEPKHVQEANIWKSTYLFAPFLKILYHSFYDKLIHLNIILDEVNRDTLIKCKSVMFIFAFIVACSQVLKDRICSCQSIFVSFKSNAFLWGLSELSKENNRKSQESFLTIKME